MMPMKKFVTKPTPMNPRAPLSTSGFSSASSSPPCQPMAMSR